jgi:uncharacterized protein involved in outer membrane biogenesis
MKRVAIGLAVFIAILIVGALVLHSSLGAIITQAVKTAGPKIIQAKVNLDETVIDATTGKGSMHGLLIGNPEGFKTKSAFKIDKVEITLDTDSITSDIVVIKEINIQAPEITYELGGNGSNIDAIQRNVAAFVKKYAGTSESKEKSAPKKSRTRMVIDHVYVKGAKLNVSATLLGGKSMTITLSDIHLQDIGKKENGATSGEVVETIIDAVNKAVHKAINPLHLENIGDAAGKVVTGAKDVVQGTAKGVTDTVSKVFGK